MAKKSKTQRAKASAARAQRKLDRENEELISSAETAEDAANNEKAAKGEKLAKSTAKTDAKAADKKAEKAKKADAKPKKKRFQFFYDVKSELKRVTWPTKQDVFRWSVVVVAALLFFGIYVALLDNVVVTPLLVAVSGLGA